MSPTRFNVYHQGDDVAIYIFQRFYLKLLVYSIVFYSILFHSITTEGRQGTTDKFVTIHFHLVLF